MTKNWKTKLIHSDAKIPEGYRSLASPTFRGSTTLFPFRLRRHGHLGSVARRLHVRPLRHAHRPWNSPRESANSNPARTPFLPPVARPPFRSINFALLQSGDHILVPASVYLSEPQARHAAALALRCRHRFLRPLCRRGYRLAHPEEHAPDLVRKSRFDHHGSSGSPGHRCGRPRTERPRGPGQHLVRRSAAGCVLPRRRRHHAGHHQIHRRPQRPAARLHHRSR